MKYDYYLPEIIRDLEEVKKISTIEDEELYYLKNIVTSLPNEFFFDTLSLENVIKYEEYLNIPSNNENLVYRIKRIQRLMFGNNSLPLSWLYKILADITGGKDNFSVIIEDYKVNIKLHIFVSTSTFRTTLDDLKKTLSEYLPCNLRWEITFELNTIVRYTKNFGIIPFVKIRRGVV